VDPADRVDGALLVVSRLVDLDLTHIRGLPAKPAEALRSRRLRLHNGSQEVDRILERSDGRVLAIEVKLGQTVTDDDVCHLWWLRQKAGADLLDAIVISTGPEAYRRNDGIGVIPAALLGP
jgi:predicted AAA+ superfamily ATPase